MLHFALHIRSLSSERMTRKYCGHQECLEEEEDSDNELCAGLTTRQQRAILNNLPVNFKPRKSININCPTWPCKEEGLCLQQTMK